MNQDEQWLLTEKYRGEKTEYFFADCKRLHAGEPLAYVIGHIPFLNTTIHLDSHPLIPRAETEFWVDAVIKDIESKESTQISVLDLCAGSGCIGTALLTTFPFIHVDFVEIAEVHHPTILKNTQVNNIDPSRFHIFGGHLYTSLSETYDYILTNPPYIDPILDRTENSVKTHEPAIALYGGFLGLTYITEIISEASRYLAEKGTLVIEHEPEQTDAIVSLSTRYGFNAITHHDQYGVLRFTVLTRKVS